MHSNFETPRLPPSRPRLRWLGWILLAMVTTVGAGHISNAISRRACEREVARWLSQEVMRDHEFMILANDDTPFLRELLDSVGARYKVQQAQPWGSIRPASAAIPFLVSVEYEWLIEDGIGEGGTRRFLCMFGTVFNLGERIDWVS